MTDSTNARSTDRLDPRRRGDFLKRYIQAREWARAHVDDYAAQIAKETGAPPAVARYSTAQITAAEFAPFDAGLIRSARHVPALPQRRGHRQNPAFGPVRL
jgi:ABC-type nitrate/sulfonate/bicarbonate transport system substrate-binding protein